MNLEKVAQRNVFSRELRATSGGPPSSTSAAEPKRTDALIDRGWTTRGYILSDILRVMQDSTYKCIQKGMLFSYTSEQVLNDRVDLGSFLACTESALHWLVQFDVEHSIEQKIYRRPCGPCRRFPRNSHIYYTYCFCVDRLARFAILKNNKDELI